jgi:hypothetical protein
MSCSARKKRRHFETYLILARDTLSRERSGTVLPMKVGGKGGRTSLEWTGETLAA